MSIATSLWIISLLTGLTIAGEALALLIGMRFARRETIPGFAPRMTSFWGRTLSPGQG